jgi:hypothetical protein
LEQESWVFPGVDTKRANVARIYDYLLGGTHNFAADRDAARTLTAIDPGMPDVAKANRAFLGRAVRFLAAAGIRQFLDIGSGVPTEGNVHEIARAIAPDSRAVYVDTDRWRSRTARRSSPSQPCCSASARRSMRPGVDLLEPRL